MIVQLASYILDKGPGHVLLKYMEGNKYAII